MTTPGARKLSRPAPFSFCEGHGVQSALVKFPSENRVAEKNPPEQIPLTFSLRKSYHAQQHSPVLHHRGEFRGPCPDRREFPSYVISNDSFAVYAAPAR